MWVLDTNTLIYLFRGEGNIAKEILARSPSAIGIPSAYERKHQFNAPVLQCILTVEWIGR
jgi:predicted nucleic acid-binding protein